MKNLEYAAMSMPLKLFLPVLGCGTNPPADQGIGSLAVKVFTTGLYQEAVSPEIK